MSVSRPERALHQLEEEDRSIWAVFAKKFDSERIRLRFPEDPSYRRPEGRFEVVSSHLGLGEMSLLVRKSSLDEKNGETRIREVVYREGDQARWVRERHIDTGEHHYILRFSHPTDSVSLFKQFADSFEIERG